MMFEMLTEDVAPSRLASTFKASLIPKVTFFVATFSIIACYYISQYYGHEPPFPGCWISGTAGHYPEYIIFRLGTISGATMMCLSWFVNHFWIHSVSQKAKFPVKDYGPVVTLVLGMMGAIGLMGSTANIDTGKRNQHWHTTCASIFFLGTALAILYDSIVTLFLLRAKVIKKTAGYLKIFTMSLILIQEYINEKYGTQKLLRFSSDPALGSDIDHIIEYTAAFTVLFYVYVISICVKNYRFSYELAK